MPRRDSCPNAARSSAAFRVSIFLIISKQMGSSRRVSRSGRPIDSIRASGGFQNSGASFIVALALRPAERELLHRGCYFSTWICGLTLVLLEPGLSAGSSFDFWPFLAVDRNRPAPSPRLLTRGRRGGGFYVFRLSVGFGRAPVPRLTRGRTFFLRRQEESSQRRRRPWVGAGCAGSLRYSGLAGAAELGAAPLGQSSPFFRQPLRCSAPPKGPERPCGSTAMLEFWPVVVNGEKWAKIKILQFPLVQPRVVICPKAMLNGNLTGYLINCLVIGCVPPFWE